MTQLLLRGTSLTASVSSSLKEALQLLESRLAAWASSSNTDVYNALLLQVFGAQSSDATSALQAALSGSGLGISLEILAGTTLSGINGAYTGATPDGAQRIYLNADWLQSATAADIEAVLLEEIGHAIDDRLNGDADTKGDEGEIFSALLRGTTPASSAFSENDQRLISLNGVAVDIEAAADTTAPTGSFGRYATAPSYTAASVNPFGISDGGQFLGNVASPALADIDGDGDLDLFVGNGVGNTLLLRNIAKAGSSAPDFAAFSPVTTVGSYATPALADIDGDGDLDLFVGNGGGQTLVLLNIGSATAPAYATADTNPYGISDVGNYASPALADIDADGDLDLFIGNAAGDIYYFRNSGNATAPRYAAASINPFGIRNASGALANGGYANPVFADYDCDGDLDLLVGYEQGSTRFSENTGSAIAPAFSNFGNSGISDVGKYARPAFADLDGDGDLDVFVGNEAGNILVFLNTAATPVAPVYSTTANGSYGIGAEITLTVQFSEAVLVDTTLGTPTLQLETGAIDRFATYTYGSGGNTLSFSYIVEAGDTAADLDQLSGTALTLHGGTIRDAAGNNAILTLAAPGAAGSLASNTQLVIVTVNSEAPSFALASDTGSSTSDGITRNGTINVAGLESTAYWEYSTNSGRDWFSGSGTSFSLAEGLYAIAQIQVRRQSSGAFLISAAAVNTTAITVDIIAPSGNLKAGDPAYVASINPFGIRIVYDAANGYNASPVFVDIDADGDLDLFIGEIYGRTLFFSNTGSATAPAYAAPVYNHFGIGSVRNFASPAFADIDADGDLDLFIGNLAGEILFYLNNGSATAPAFAASPNPSGISGAGLYTSPALADIDSDGDFDLFLGNSVGNTLFFRNTGSATAPAYAAAATNPFGISGVGSYASPAFGDADGDGDLDLLIGNVAGNTVFFRNTGSPTAPAYAATTANPFGIIKVGNYASPALADLDADGDLDLLIGQRYVNTFYFRNIGSATPVALVNSTTANGSYTIGTVITLTVGFSEAVLVTGTPLLQLETGAIDRFATYSSGSGSNILSFSYTVQAGDSSADLDQLSSTALTVNGGTIRDAAGNNAILTLAASGATGSLGANAQLVIDTTAPTGSFGSYATAPAYAAAVTNPFGISDVFRYASPVFADAEADGDLDLFIGDYYGNTLVFRNTGSAAAPASAAASTNPFGISNVGNYASPALADFDGDGDLDLFIGNGAGNTRVFLNTSSAAAPSYAAAAINPFGISNVGGNASPLLADFDGDGDLDLFIGNRDGNTLLFSNTAEAGSSAPAYAAASTNPFGISNVGGNASPLLADFDGDGDLDLFIGNGAGNTLVFRNTGSATAPAYAAASTNPFGISNVGNNASPALADLDGDGDLDLVIGNNTGNTLVFRNTAATPIAPVHSTTANGTYLIGAVITLSVGFSEAVLVSGIPQLQLETGAVDRFATYSSGSGSNTLSFSYTVQAGDSSADLDQLSSIALTLNGGTIQDAAGNNAILTLAVPGAAGSLATNAQLVIDAVAPEAPTFTLASDTGFSNSDGITSDSTINVAGLEATANWEYSINSGSGWNSGSGTFFSLAEGVYAIGQIQVRQSDAAGNTSVAAANTTAITVDAKAPSGTLRATAPAYAAPSTNPFGISNVGYYASPALADLDGDGDLDLFIGENYGNTLFFRNTASHGATAPAYAAAAINPFGISNVGSRANPALADFDGDGDLDLFIGNVDGNTLVFRNTANPGATAPAYAAGSINPVGISSVGFLASPALADFDGDGDLDLFIGDAVGNTLVFCNTAEAGSSAPAYAAAANNPFGISDVGYYASPALADIDGDGDLDLVIGNAAGQTLVFSNTGNATAPAYAAPSTNPFGISDVGNYASPALADLDGDGDLDLVIGELFGNTLVFRNTAAPSVAPVNSTTANGSYRIGAVITLTVGFSEAVLVTGTPQLQLETGAVDRFASYSSGSGSHTLSFSYTVQAGDTSPDLDQLSSTALTLHGGTIRDAAGNNAILTLAAPGDAGSLASNAQLLIDTAAPEAPTFAIASDTGSSTSDGITSNGTINVAGLESAASWEYRTNSGSGWFSGSGTSFSLADGLYAVGRIQVRQSDAAGNTSAAAANTTTIIVDNTAPTGSFRATAPAYAAAANPFGISNVGLYASPALADLDGDGDLDLFIGEFYGNTLMFRNTGSAAAPAYATATTNPFGISHVGNYASPTLADLDADGDLDLFIGNINGQTLVFRNTAVAGSSAPAYAAAATNPFGISNVGSKASPALADFDADGDLDLFIGNGDGNTRVFRNTGSATAPAYAAGSINPFGISNVGGNASPVLADLDGDGDLDLVIGNRDGNTLLFSNTAEAGSSAPAYAAAATNPFGISDVGAYASPALADADADGDLDLFIGNQGGNTLVFRNTAASPTAPVCSTTANGTYGIGTVITLTVGFSEAVLVSGTPLLQLETGAVDRFATYSSGSGSNILSFSYTVQAGDTAADLDQLSSTALTLNGGTIQDAAGNSAILTLAAPSATGSLAVNAALMIATAPTGSFSSTINTDTGASTTISTGGFTKDNTLGLAGTYAVANGVSVSSIEIYDGLTKLGTAILSSDTWSYTSAALAVGLHSFTAKVIDMAGNSFTTSPAVIATVDTTAPTGSVSDTIATNTGATPTISSGGVTKDNTLGLAGTYADANGVGSVEIYDGVRKLGIATISGGAWSFTTSALVDGLHSFTAKVIDTTGNTFTTSPVVTASVDTTAATGSLGSDATAPSYASAVTNLFGISDVGDNARPAFADVDADGDLDLFIGNRNGDTHFFSNTVASGAIAPAYAAAVTNPFGIRNVGSNASPAFADADGDGDLDLFIGTSNGKTLFFSNTANLGATAPAYAAAVTNPFGISNVGSKASPAFADADADGDLDLFIGDNYGNTVFCRNTANPGATAPVYAAGAINPFGISNVGNTASPAFADADGDGDLDLFIGQFYGNTLFYRNTAAAGATAPAYAPAATNPFGISDVGYSSKPAFADSDADGDLDLFIGISNGNTRFFRNTAAAPVAPLNSSTANGSYGVGSVITLTVQFAEAVLVTGSPQLQLETGSIDRFAAYSSGSGSSTLTFTYTVQAGDTSADLDQLSANALTLNDGTIQDAAGNNAIRTLALPGAAGSLGAHAALVIDTIAPTLLNSTPAAAAASVGLSSNFVLNFSETVVAGSGLISLYRANGTLVESFNVANGLGSAGGSVGFSGSAVTINPFADLVRGTGYDLQVAATAVCDGAGNAYTGISDATSLNFATAPVTVSVGSITVSESSLYGVVEVGLDAPISDYLFFTPSLLNGTASIGVDTGSTIWAFVGGSWVSAASGVTLAAGSTSVLLRVPINNDTTLEGLENFQFCTGVIGGAGAGSLTNAAGATGSVTIADDGSSAQIFDQDSNSASPLIRSTDNDAPSIAVSSVIVSEASPKGVLQVSLSNPSNFPISFTPYLQSGSATIGTDSGSTLEVFNGSSWETAGVVSFAAGVISRLLRVAIHNDSDYEGSESFTINTGTISGTVANPAGASGTIIIRDNGSSSNTFLATNNSATPTVGTADNDTPPLPALSAVVLANGNETGPLASSFRISRTGSTTGALLVTYRFVGNAIAGSDYTNPAGFDATTGLGTITILAGQSSVDLSVPTLNDSAVDGNRSLSLTLQSSLTYTIAAATATASIFDNDVAPPLTPILAISAASLVETDSGSNPIVNLIVSLSAAATSSVSVHVRTLAASSGSSATGTTATGGGDYVAISDQLLTFVPGVTSQLLAIQLLGDNTIESTESFRVELFNVSGANLPAATATIEIVDNDTGKSLTIDKSATTTPQIFSGGQYADVLIGGSAGDTINGDPAGLIGSGDAISGGPGADILTGGPGADRFRYASFSDSTLTSTDRIRDLTLTGSDQDRIALAALPSALWNTGVITPASPTLANAVVAAFADKDVITSGNQALNAGEAVLFAYDSTPGNSRTRQWFVAVNNSTAGFSASDDLLINVTGLTSTFATGSLTPNLLFATL